MNSDPTSLDRLHDIVAPPSVPWWPPAPGWYGIATVILVLLLVFILRSIIHWQRNRYRREALAEFARQEKFLGDPFRRSAALAALAELLKRVALTAFPREQVAALTGPAWFDFLDRTGSTTMFASDAGPILARATYDPLAATRLEEQEIRETAALVRHWIVYHEVPLSRSANVLPVKKTPAMPAGREVMENR
jgi:Domain of unknown function (DUF4381)